MNFQKVLEQIKENYSKEMNSRLGKCIYYGLDQCWLKSRLILRFKNNFLSKIYDYIENINFLQHT